MKKIKLKRPLLQLFESGNLPDIDRSKLTPKSLAQKLMDLRDEFYETYDKNKWYIEHLAKSAAALKSMGIKNISEIRVLERTNSQTGDIETCQPYRIAALARHYMKRMAQDPVLSPFAKYFPKSIIWVDNPHIQTAATDGCRIFWNVWFAEEMFGKDVELYNAEAKTNPRVDRNFYHGLAFMFVTIHEIYHQIYQHFHREQLKPETRNGQNHMLANIAEDAEINRDIMAQFPQYFAKIGPMLNCVYDPRFPEEPWEYIFDAYMTGTPPPQNQQQGQNSQGGQQSSQGAQSGGSGNSQSNNNQGSDQGAGQSAGDQNQGQGQPGQGGSGGQSGQNDDNMLNGNGTGDMTKSQMAGINDAIDDLRSGANKGMNKLDPNQPLGPNVGAGIPDFNEDEYREGYNAAIDACQEAIDNIKNGKDVNGNSMDPSESSNGEGGDGDEFDYNKPVRSAYDGANDGRFDKPDKLSREELRKIAEESGQPLDEEDLSENPGRRADKWVNENKGGFAKGSGNGVGNLAKKLTDIQEMLKPKIKWQNLLKRWMSMVVKKDKERKFSRKLIGSRNPEHRMVRYTKPKIVTPEGKGGITQILHVIDTSGSMFCGDYKKKFEQVFREIVSIGSKLEVACSRACEFADHDITREDFITWSDSDKAPKVLNKLAELLLGDGGGTDMCRSLETIYKLGKPFYNNSLSEPTLTLVYTDGDIGSKAQHEHLPAVMRKNMCFVIVTDASTIERTITQLVEYGYNVNQCIPIDVDRI